MLDQLNTYMWSRRFLVQNVLIVRGLEGPTLLTLNKLGLYYWFGFFFFTHAALDLGV
jgi:hypothetical protein